MLKRKAPGTARYPQEKIPRLLPMIDLDDDIFDVTPTVTATQEAATALVALADEDGDREAAGPFRLQAKGVFLTFSCPTEAEDNPIPSKEALLQFLKTLPKYKGSIVCKELHETNGKAHYHCWVDFDPKLHTVNARLFDCYNVHPNIRTGHKQERIRYITKKGDYIEDGVHANEVTKTQKKDNAAKAAIEMAKGGDLNGAVTYCQENMPYDYLRYFRNFKETLTEVHNKANPSKTALKIREDNWTPEVLNMDITELEESLRHPGHKNTYLSTYVLVGPAGIGKTQAAAYLLKKAGCNNIRIVRSAEHLKTALAEDSTIDGFVFDECAVNNVATRGGRWTREAQIQLVDQENDGPLPCRNSDIILLSKIKRILTTNDLASALNVAEEPIKRRIKVVEMNDNLFVL